MRKTSISAPVPSTPSRRWTARPRAADASVAALGAVYTPAALADWAAELLAARLPRDRGVVLDPACGDGALLFAATRRGVADVVGVDCDRSATARARRRLTGATFHTTDGLRFLAGVSSGKRPLEIIGVVANPPWGAELPCTREELSALGYRLTSGQVDSWDLFAEGAVRAAAPNAAIVLIVPDALFLPEHRAVRELLATRVTIDLVARLGEGIFPGVYRGTVVLAIRKRLPTVDTIVSCVRIPAERRRELLAGITTFAAVAAEMAHRVPQQRFQDDPAFRFDIQTREGERGRMVAFAREAFPWDEWLESGRGIELSKRGEICRCPRCGTARPLPRGNGAACCTACGSAWDASAAIEAIVAPICEAKGEGWHPLIVGEDVNRHACAPSRAIRVDIPGIRYKSLDTFALPKLLVRKTGVGIKATVDMSGAATNQVVFHFVRRPAAPAELLDYLEGVLCSRILLAWHLKQHGETEWRSHPYITQHVIRQFPVPTPRTPGDLAQANAIAFAVRRRRAAKGEDSPEDLEVERLVAGMFGMTTADMAWVLGVLDAAQGLEPIRTLRLPSATAIAPVRVAAGPSQRPAPRTKWSFVFP